MEQKKIDCGSSTNCHYAIKDLKAAGYVDGMHFKMDPEDANQTVLIIMVEHQKIEAIIGKYKKVL